MVSTASSSAALPPARHLSVPGERPLALRVRGAKPRGGTVPLVLHFHGGAFVSGDLDSGACLAELLAGSGAVVASLAYPLAPAHRFPDAVEAGYAALEWLFKQRTRLAGSGAPLFVAGEEAGGNLAAAVALMVRDRAHPPLAGQILVSPMLDPCNATASLRQTMGEATCCKWMEGWQQYLRGPMDAEHPYAVPGRAQRLTGLPPALILTSGDDPMRDEALAYAERLREAGIAVHSGLMPPTTGWPDSLSEQAAGECPCAVEVRGHVRAFYQAATPPPS
ncbi:alpha/beta hydrolase [Hydrogenophaga laconesensis]|uniref:Acetyl esterase/lipase n=1 Tax=Hydrogenophaga laconesensis TaxID=1805971 RepID=A0ABU1VBK4_9BURK|nr:alpha/beta hydrolase [Hydrogenophaga laconesensis]MDR7094688.1 acetyl esterase/lipase [Hydrogenophaga laconesensis]